MASFVQSAKVLVIAGTTAVGKTDLSIELAKRINGEIISADSVQVYRHMDIGSAKVDSKSQAEIPHHLINVVDIKDNFSAGDYFDLAKTCLEDIISRGKTPIVVGGTWFYIDFLLSGTTGAPPSTNESRTNVDSYLGDAAGDWDKCLDKLRSLDPVYADTLCLNDWYRLKRALDICLQSSRTVTSFKRVEGSQSLPYQFKCLFLTMARIEVFNRIDTRCEQLIKAGLIQETASLVRYHGLQPDTPTGDSIGYRQTLDYLSQEWNYPSDKGDLSKEQHKTPLEMRTGFLEYLYLYQARTRQLAQRQSVRFKNDARFQWVNMAPGGERVELGDTADKVRLWFNGDHTHFPSELDGTSLKTLSQDELRLLKVYSASQHERLQIYNNDTEIDSVLQNLTEFIKTIQ